MYQEASVYTLRKLSTAEQQPYGLRVLTMRRWPRGIRRLDIDLWIPSAGPSIDLLAALHMGAIGWEMFLLRYCEEQEQQQSCRVVSYDEQGKPVSRDYPHRSLDHLQNLERQRGIVTLLCWESGPLCHRHTLKRLAEALQAANEGGDRV